MRRNRLIHRLAGAAALVMGLAVAGVIATMGQDASGETNNLCDPANPRLVPLSEMKQERTRDGKRVDLFYTNEQGETFQFRLLAADPKLIENAIRQDKVCFDLEASAVPVDGVFWKTINSLLGNSQEVIVKNPDYTLPEIIEGSGFAHEDVVKLALETLRVEIESGINDGSYTPEAGDEALRLAEAYYVDLLQPPDIEVDPKAPRDDGKVNFIFEITNYAAPENFTVRGTEQPVQRLKSYDLYLHFYIDPTVAINEKRWYTRPGGVGSAQVTVSAPAGSVEASLRTSCNSIAAIWSRSIPTTQASGWKTGVAGVRIKGMQNNSRFAISGTWTRNENSSFTSC